MFCSKFFTKIKSWFKKVDDFLIANVDKALEITTALKKAIDSPLALALTDIIPGKWDDLTQQLGSQYLDFALKDLGFFKQMIDKTLTMQQKLELLKDYMKDLAPYERQAYLVKLASRLTSYFDDNRQEDHKYDLIAQVRYSLIK